jgi:hypothetical protein
VTAERENEVTFLFTRPTVVLATPAALGRPVRAVPLWDEDGDARPTRTRDALRELNPLERRLFAARLRHWADLLDGEEG